MLTWPLIFQLNFRLNLELDAAFIDRSFWNMVFLGMNRLVRRDLFEIFLLRYMAIALSWLWAFGGYCCSMGITNLLPYRQPRAAAGY